MQLTGQRSGDPAFSPDGKLLAYGYRDEQANRLIRLAIISFADGQRVKTFDLPQNVGRRASLRWTHDGRAVTYVDTRDGVDNIWGQSLTGGPAKQLTNFKSEQIIKFAWSRDGKLVLSGGHSTDDVVLIRDFK